MARSQPKTAPKPLMIRGDRLLLALDALATMFERPVAGMSPMRVRRAINGLLDRPPNGDCPPLAYVYRQLDPDGTLRLVLRTSAGTIALVAFDAHVLIERVRPGHYLRVHEYLERFFSAVARDELTAQDFHTRRGAR